VLQRRRRADAHFDVEKATDYVTGLLLDGLAA
jgi:hypothetical protein